MSLILDALRKLDRQKSLSRKGTEGLAASVLKLEPSPSKKKWKLYLAAVSLTAVVTAAVTYLTVVGFGSWGKSSPIPPANLPASGKQLPRAPRGAEAILRTSPAAPEKPSLAGRQVPPAATPEPDRSAKSSPPPIAPSRASLPRSEAPSSTATVPQEALTEEPILSLPSGPRVADPPSKSGSPTGSSPLASEPPVKKSPIPPPDTLPRESVREIQSGKTREPSKMENQPGTKAPASAANEKTADWKAASEMGDRSTGMAKKPAETAVTGPSSSPPRLKISGIVWHDEPAKRRAVINGVFTTEGSVIEGLKVVEILPTRVRFLHQGRPLEISIFE